VPELRIALLTFTAALVAGLVWTPIVIRLSWAVLALDRPDARKQHGHAVPRLGGVALLASFVCGIGTALWASGYSGSLYVVTRYQWIGWIAAVLALFACGLIDDVRGLGVKSKFAIQILAGVVVIVAGFRIDHILVPGVGLIHLGWVAVPATLLWLVAVTNAINLIDGLDGLAAGIGFLITATVAAISYYHGVFSVTVIAIALAGSLLGFLPYNFSPARIFLGDSGSQILGFTLAVISIRGSQKSATLVAILAPIIVLGLPILDTVLVVARRAVRIKAESAAGGLRARVRMSGSLFAADREHIHHNLLEWDCHTARPCSRSMSPRRSSASRPSRRSRSTMRRSRCSWPYASRPRPWGSRSSRSGAGGMRLRGSSRR
jgi:UDP-GlcNAc:undecaprenyl-phosphate GlcNAc-1-phosphate transferase